jgi:hypothetical protein
MRESSYVVTEIRVTLDEGSKFENVFVAWGSEIVKVGLSEKFHSIPHESFQ